MKKCTIHSGLTAVLAAMAGLIATLSTSVPAQEHAIVVNGLSCPTASVQFSSAGMAAILPAGSAGNGNPCDSVFVTFSSAAIYISATSACLTASAIPARAALQTVSVNGNGCYGATVTWSATGIAISAPHLPSIQTVSRSTPTHNKLATRFP